MIKEFDIKEQTNRKRLHSMKIGVISDTHLSAPSEDLHRIAEDVFSDVSMVIHAGDLTRYAVLGAFARKKIIAVRGNMDCHDVQVRLPQKDIVEIQGYRIGVIHGWGPPKGIEDRIIGQFDDVHVIVYGHSHQSANHIKNGILMFNPGAFAGAGFTRSNPSVGILTLSSEGLSGEIIKI